MEKIHRGQKNKMLNPSHRYERGLCYLEYSIVRCITENVFDL